MALEDDLEISTKGSREEEKGEQEQEELKEYGKYGEEKAEVEKRIKRKR